MSQQSSYLSFIINSNVVLVLLSHYSFILQQGGTKIEDSSSSFYENLVQLWQIFFIFLKIYYSFRCPSSYITYLNNSRPRAVLGQIQDLSELHMPWVIPCSNYTGQFGFLSLQTQKVFLVLKLHTVRLKDEYSCEMAATLSNSLSIFWSTSFPFYSNIKPVSRKLQTSLPLDCPFLIYMRSQLVKKTSMPVWILIPSQVPPETRSLPAQIFLSSSNG